MIVPHRYVGSIVRRAWSRFRGVRESQPALLEMIWPESKLDTPPKMVVHPDYRMRQWLPQDQSAYSSLIAAAGIPPFSMEYWHERLLPDGFFVIEHAATGALVATCMAVHRPSLRHTRAGNLGWLAADPMHAGKQLGRTVSAAVTARLIAAGYRRIYLETHDFRLPAIRTYLVLGWVPLFYQPDMHDRWAAICERLKLPFTPDDWPIG